LEDGSEYGKHDVLSFAALTFAVDAREKVITSARPFAVLFPPSLNSHTIYEMIAHF
jgi:hypothetical protein